MILNVLATGWCLAMIFALILCAIFYDQGGGEK